MQSMTVNNLSCRVNLPVAPEGDGTHSLPPRKLIDVFDVDDYPACPSNWMHGGKNSASFFFPVEAGRHLWLDFNQNAYHTHDVAIVMSIQGVNPIIGPVSGHDAKKLKMEQYKVGDPCPVHGNPDSDDYKINEDGSPVTLQAGLFCEECGFKWPTQNYMTTTSCPKGVFWIDGWRADGDSIRGFLITADVMKGIAAQTIGDERVWAIGIAFFLSKEAKPAPPAPPQPVHRKWSDETVKCSMPSSYNFNDTLESLGGGMKGGGGVVFGASLSADTTLSDSGGEAPVRSRSLRSRGGPCGQSVNSIRENAPVREVEVEKLEIGGGATIGQVLAHPDPKSLDHYEEAAAGVLYGNYCPVADFQAIMEAGKKDRTAGGEGFMAGLETGNP